MLNVADFGPNPATPELGQLDVCHVPFGKAMRGSPPRRRAVATVMPWATEALRHLDGSSVSGGGHRRHSHHPPRQPRRARARAARQRRRRTSSATARLPRSPIPVPGNLAIPRPHARTPDRPRRVWAQGCAPSVVYAQTGRRAALLSHAAPSFPLQSLPTSSASTRRQQPDGCTKQAATGRAMPSAWPAPSLPTSQAE
jgi:hypothetical protein